MTAELINGSPSVRANCPTCEGALANFMHTDGRNELGAVVDPCSGRPYNEIYALLRCSGCGRGALVRYRQNSMQNRKLVDFYPRSIAHAALPAGVPEGVTAEYREAERCAANGEYRAATAMVRSALEKVLKANGYTTGPLAAKIDAAAADGVITASRRQRAHEDVRVLGNEVVHDEWREVGEPEVTSALHYTQRLIEDLYDDRASVDPILRAKNRIP